MLARAIEAAIPPKMAGSETICINFRTETGARDNAGLVLCAIVGYCLKRKKKKE
jgi:hypothetical protein